MEEEFVLLIASSGPYQRFAIEGVLKGAGIPYVVREPGFPMAVFGQDNAYATQEFLVSPGRLQEAKDGLCANGILCDVSERLLSHALERIVKPLLQKGERDLSQLARFIEVNNKETAKALLEAALREEGGLALLEDVFFRLDREEDAGPLRLLARVLGAKASSSFWEKIQSVMTSGSLDGRIAILGVLPELPPGRKQAEILTMGLRDPTFEVRDAAGEALFALGRGDFGYEPGDPEEKRERAIEKFLMTL